MRATVRMPYLRSLHRRYERFAAQRFFVRAPHMVGVDPKRLTPRLLRDLYDNYYRRSLMGFLERVRFFCLTDDIFAYLTAYGEDWHDLLVFAEFLKKEGILRVKNSGAPVVRKKEFLRLFPPMLSRRDIAARIEEKLRVRLRPRLSVAELMQKFVPVRVDARLDQMPVSQESALVVIEKIIRTLPIPGPFLIVGDDDFLSVLLALACPAMEIVVVDADKALLAHIEYLARVFHLRIKTRAIDLASAARIPGDFVGFLCNPMYTEYGVRRFMEYGLRHLGRDGGFAFLEVGDEAIGNRMLFLQEFFSARRLMIRDMVAGELYYPFRLLHKEDETTIGHIASILDIKHRAKIARLGATLYIFEYIPFAVKRGISHQPFYAYV